MTTVYFATNRAPDANAPGGYGATMVAKTPDAATYAVADVAVSLADADAGTITAISDKQQGNWSQQALEHIVSGHKNLLVFIHGFDNSFADAIHRAAFNAEWFRASGAAAADTTVLAFTWPSLGEVFESGLHLPDEAYRTDQQQSGASGYHLDQFLDNVSALVGRLRTPAPGSRVFLLAHSMGNHALQAAMSTWQGPPAGAPTPAFDEVLLAAADEVATSLDDTAGGGLVRLADLATRITVYSSRKDAVLWLSSTINGNARLGHDGPPNKTVTAIYPPTKFRFMDCSDVSDFPDAVLSENTHQYYRMSPTVRADIATVMTGNASPSGGCGALSAPPLPTPPIWPTTS
jgi:esterase/lipase superfamily enzyme